MLDINELETRINRIERMHNANFRLSQAAFKGSTRAYGRMGRIAGIIDYDLSVIKRMIEAEAETATADAH